ncbi:adenosine kinase [Sphingomonas sediminicola]|jgi:sugar/nucleoside kinase (ribokinase family)|uniref:Adenosine kinase n=1 Tax=Sphingomonas sediminicola TaxID=386874 RepID=A0ABX6T7P8_9SPHN|nr:adenosine kinase [Sphingomonas sediminicola]QNP45881.1 adenosine kinase [Sphingomonas sediminicola]
MTDCRLDVLCIGNAIVDVIANATDDFLDAEGLVKGSMRLIDAEEAERLYSHMGPAHEVSGGSAGNTAAGIAAFGGRAGFIGQVAPDQLGQFYRHDLTAAGVEFITPASDIGIPTARSMILVTPDGHRTMNTFLGAAQHLPASALDEEQIRSAKILYLEGYLWDPETPRYAMVRAIEVAREAGRKVAFTLSDTFCVDRHRDGFNELIDGGRIDILFANQAEIEALAGIPHLESAVAAVKDKVETLVVTRSEDGALATRGSERADVPAEPIGKLVDTTGAGDLFAAGFLLGSARGRSLEESLRMGAIAAAEVIQHYGARPEADLKALAGDLVE